MTATTSLVNEFTYQYDDRPEETPLIEYTERISIHSTDAEFEDQTPTREEPSGGADSLYETRSRCLVIGSLLVCCGTLMSMVVFGMIGCQSAFSMCGERIHSTCDEEPHTCHRHPIRWSELLRGRYQPPITGITTYFNLFGRQQQSINRAKGDFSSSSHPHFSGPQLVIAGKMTVEDGPCNIAQLNLRNNEWSLNERIQLSLYNSYSGGEVYSLLANHTSEPVDGGGGERYDLQMFITC